MSEDTVVNFGLCCCYAVDLLLRKAYTQLNLFAKDIYHVFSIERFIETLTGS